MSALLSLRGVALRVGGLEILSCVDLDLQAGETLGLIGPNGAGKTTLFNIINGMARPSAGQVLLDGADLRAHSPIQRARLGLVRSFQTSRIFPELNLLQNLALAVRLKKGCGYRWWGRDAARRDSDAAALALLEHSALAGRGHIPARSLSYGEQRILDLLIALAQQPRVLLLDEPTAGLSESESREVIALVHAMRGQCAVLLISHDIDIVFQECDRIAVLSSGNLLTTGTPAQVRRHAGARQAYLGELALETA
ncbi:MAG: ABC transporter ATP-binding protein [Alcaligenes sp.]